MTDQGPKALGNERAGPRQEEVSSTIYAVSFNFELEPWTRDLCLCATHALSSASL